MSGSVSGLPPPRPAQPAVDVGSARADGQRAGHTVGTDGPQSAAQVTLSARAQRVQGDILRRVLKDEPSRPSVEAASEGPDERVKEESPQERPQETTGEQVERIRERAEQATERRLAEFAEGYVRLYHSQHPELTEAQAREEVLRLLGSQVNRNEGAARAPRRTSDADERGHTLQASG